MSNSCQVCHSTVNVSCNHFGARTCKACAAFFRRTVSMKLDYSCIEDPDSCRVHYESKLICRFCRLKKCQKVGMKPVLVKSKNERKQYIRISKGLVRKKSPLRSCDTAESEEDGQIKNEATPGPSSEPSFSADIQEIMTKIIKLESAMCDRRRLLYAETPISIVLESGKEWPYDNMPLKMFDYKASQGPSKHDFVMIMDYARGLPGFEELNYTDSVFCYRTICATDFVMASAFYTYKRGTQYDELVLNDGTFVPMNPAPLTGYEENANLLFQNQDDLIKFRTLMPLLAKQWQVSLQFAKLEMSIEEFALLKAICVWSVSYYRLSESGRCVASAQRDRLIRALHHACQLRNEAVLQNSQYPEDVDDEFDDVGERLGNAIMALSYIMEQIRNLNCSLVMISFFGILNVDSLMIDVTSFW
uniref:Nuclear receptor domain-containing protein n=1 Tax=Caenorhabditis japonica TaxID=281687 RepID=A0A8R1HJA1_CAEJA